MKDIVRDAARRGAAPTWVLAPLLWIGLMSFTGPSHALTIQFMATDLTNTTPGEDLWRYDYRVSNGTFLKDQGFFIEFDYNTYSNLQDPPPAVNGDWDVLVTQPDLALTDNGLYDALALADGPSLNDLFSLTFVWGGGATAPGSQPYTIYDASLTTIQTGNTIAVPIPASEALVQVGLAGLFFLVARRRLAARGQLTKRKTWHAQEDTQG
jgi:hypothetical protein